MMNFYADVMTGGKEKPPCACASGEGTEGKYMWNNAKWIGISKEQIRAEQIYAGDLNGRFA